MNTASLTAETGVELPDLSVYYHIEALDERLDDLADRMQQLDGIEAAYVKPPAEPAQFIFNEMAPQVEEIMRKFPAGRLRLRFGQ